ncbi:MAG TPA: class I SAM-dependent methyltransferase [Acidimicrobiales bacterium]|nr:class I SAM-dependent methyltransferase [Acidimicrobiales bacterium]
MNRLAAALYDRALAGVEEAGLRRWRRELLSGLSGRVIEIGAGTGANLDLYPPAVSGLVLVEPDRNMRRRLSARAARHRLTVEVVPDAAEHLPFPDGCFDAAVSTLVLCSAGDPAAVLRELRRVLRPGGTLVVIEHVGAGSGGTRARWQRRIEPAWKRLAGNCHLTRDTAAALADAGFDTSTLVAEDMPRAPGIVRPTIRGVLAASTQ